MKILKNRNFGFFEKISFFRKTEKFDFSKTFLATLDIKMHYLCTWKNIIDILQKNEILSKNKIENLKFFLTEPEKWRQINE